MAFRKRMSRGRSRKNFKRGSHVKKKNYTASALRGGYRI
ncbi:MAG: hypothetical protein [Microvirus sp.]|nr:MAG: hypothetical protein [Microvirus sp.]